MFLYGLAIHAERDAGHGLLAGFWNRLSAVAAVRCRAARWPTCTLCGERDSRSAVSRSLAWSAMSIGGLLVVAIEQAAHLGFEVAAALAVVGDVGEDVGLAETGVA